MSLPRLRFAIRSLMTMIAAVALFCGVLSWLAGMESWDLVGLVILMIGFYLVASFAFGLVLDLIDARRGTRWVANVIPGRNCGVGTPGASSTLAVSQPREDLQDLAPRGEHPPTVPLVLIHGQR